MSLARLTQLLLLGIVFALVLGLSFPYLENLLLAILVPESSFHQSSYSGGASTIDYQIQGEHARYQEAVRNNTPLARTILIGVLAAIYSTGMVALSRRSRTVRGVPQTLPRQGMLPAGGRFTGLHFLHGSGRRYVTIFGVLASLVTIFVWLTGKPSLRSLFTSSSPAPLLPGSAVIAHDARVTVPADVFWRDTGVDVQKGDWLHFAAEGTWWSGISTTSADGAEGIFGLFRPACGDCPVPEGNLGELLGKVDDGAPFRIGTATVKDMDRSGRLFLTMNENTGPCFEGTPGSCYTDNNGIVHVRVTIWRIP